MTDAVVEQFVLAATGHRPDKLGGYAPDVLERLTDLARASLVELNPDEVIVGMALGWDTAVALAAIDLAIPFIAAVPFAGQERMWPKESQDRFHSILKQAKEVVIVSPGGYSPWKMQVRNEWMVDRCTKLLSLWNGTMGGTKNCVDYALRNGKPTVNVWSSWETYARDPAPTQPSPDEALVSRF